MKRIIVAAACTLAASAAGTTLAASCYANDPSWGGGLSPAAFLGPQLPSSHATAPASTSPAVAGELAALTGQGLSPERAAQALNVQAKVANASLPGKLQAAMGNDFAGVWFENAAAQLYVGATSRAGRQAAERVVSQAGLAGVVRIVPVRSTMAQLLDAQNQWNGRISDLFASRAAQTSIDPQHNAVSLTLGSGVPRSRRAALKREAAAGDVNVAVAVAAGSNLSVKDYVKECVKFTKSIANCDPPSISAGVGIGSEGTSAFCTAGPSAVPLGNRNERVLLTAGHCFEGLAANSEWFAFNTNSTKLTIGKGIEFNIGSNGTADLLGDYGDIRIEATGGWRSSVATNPVLAVIAEWLLPEEKRYKVKGERTPTQNAADCHSGLTTGQQCGVITALNVLAIGGSGKPKEGLVQGTAFAEPGDSGGPWFFAEPEASGFEALMEGTLVGRNEALTLYTFDPLKQPVTGAARGSLEVLNLELLTTSNETLPAGQWDVNGTKLVGYAPLASTATVLSHGELVAAGVGVICTGSTVGITFGELTQSEVRAQDLTFSKCTATKPCSLASETLLTLPLHGIAQLDGTSNTLVTVLPLPSKTIAVIRFEGAECALLGAQPLTGTLDLLIDGGGEAAATHVVLGFSLKGALKLGSSEATFTAFTADLKLASEQTWKFL
jgi:hypothetical protein